MNLQEAVNRSRDTYGRYDYPDIIDSSAGLCEFAELGVVGIPSWDRLGRGKTRKAILEIRTFCGISSDAIHCYGKLVVDGVYTATIGNLDKPKGITDGEELNHPLLNYSYQLKITRPLTKFEIDTQPDRWYCAEEGDLVEGYESMQELIRDVKEIFRLRFAGTWDFYIQYPNGKKELSE